MKTPTYRIRDNGHTYSIERHNEGPLYYCGIMHEEWSTVAVYDWLCFARLHLWILRFTGKRRVEREARLEARKRAPRILNF